MAVRIANCVSSKRTGAPSQHSTGSPRSTPPPPPIVGQALERLYCGQHLEPRARGLWPGGQGETSAQKRFLKMYQMTNASGQRCPRALQCKAMLPLGDHQVDIHCIRVRAKVKSPILGLGRGGGQYKREFWNSYSIFW